MIQKVEMVEVGLHLECSRRTISIHDFKVR